MIATGNYIGRLLRNRWTPPDPDALFDSRSGLTISDSIGGENLTIKSFSVMNLLGDNPAWLSLIQSLEAPVTTSGNWTFLSITRNESSDTVSATANHTQLNGNNRGTISYLRTGALHSGAEIVTAGDPLYSNPNHAQICSTSDVWVTWITFDATGDVVRIGVNGHQLDTANGATAWRLGVASGNLAYGASANATNLRMFGLWIFDRVFTEAEFATIASTGVFPADVPSRQFVNLNYGDKHSERVIASHNRKSCPFLNNGTNASIPAKATIWTKRYDNAALAYHLFYGYTKHGNDVMPYTPTGAKMMAAATGDMEYLASSCIHNMAESMIDFAGVTDADIKAIFNKADRTYWNVSIESTDYYSLGAYLWHPSELVRTFITTHAETGHENHIFASLRTSGQTITGLTALRVYKTSL